MGLTILLLGGDRRPVGHGCVGNDGDCSSRSSVWCKGAMNSPVGGRSPRLVGSKCRFLVALLSSLIDKYRVSATPVYTLATRTDGAWRHWNLACYLLTVSPVHILYAITAAAACCRQNREHFSILTYCMIECLRPRPYNGLK